jgi:Rho GDP-dissociation inhibitor
MSSEDQKEEELTENQVNYKAADTASKNVGDLLAKDADDESLRKYKESLLGAAAQGDLGDPNDPRRIIVTEFRVIFDPAENHPDIVFNLDTDAGIQHLRANGLTIKEGAQFKFQVSFRVQHEICAGLKFVDRLKKAVFTNSNELMIGSYPPASKPHVFTFPRYGYSEAPKGMLYRGRYSARNQFIDSDGVTHLEYEYDVNISKNWE